MLFILLCIVAGEVEVFRSCDSEIVGATSVGDISLAHVCSPSKHAILINPFMKRIVAVRENCGSTFAIQE